MKRFRSLYSIAILALLALTACQSDDVQLQNEQEEVGEGITRVHLRISSQGSMQTRAWQDTNAGDDELMNIWTVVVVDNADNEVKSVRVANPVAANKEIDNLETTVNLESGHTYRFYSFANIHPKVIMELMPKMAISSARTRATDDLPVNFPTNINPTTNTTTDNSNTGTVNYIANSNPYSTIVDGLTWNSFSTQETRVKELINEDDYAAFKTVVASSEAMSAICLSVPGNGFNPQTDPNIYGAKGIPMTNVQEREVSGTDTDIDLILVRAMAKIELRLYNETGSDLYIRSATLTNLTANTVGNLYLLPILDYMNDMDATHKDVQPHLANSIREHYTYNLSTPLKVGAVTGDDVTAQKTAYTSGAAYNNQIVTFYVNESELPNNTDRYYLTLGVSKTADGAISEYRYAIINGLNTTGEELEDWHYISRNDYRIIPLVLDDYQLKLVPYDFPAIGVLPCSVIEGDVYNTLTFHDYGHFHLLPYVTRFSDPDAEIPMYDPTWADATTPDVYWTLGADKSTDWSNSTLDGVLKWYADASFTTQLTTKNADGFYRTDADETTERGAVATEDADDAGGVPRWDNTLKWKPTTSNAYRPFIYGYIAEPQWVKNATDPTDLYQYHSLTVKLWKKGEDAPFRDLTLNFRMLLSSDQLSTARMRTNVRRHHHH